MRLPTKETAVGAAIAAGIVAALAAAWSASRINTERRCQKDANRRIMDLEYMHDARMREKAEERRDRERHMSDLRDENQRLRERISIMSARGQAQDQDAGAKTP